MARDVTFDAEALAQVCRRYHVARLDLFGSRAAGLARPDSDVDVLVTFEAGYTPGWELAGLVADLQRIFDRPVDLITRWTLDHDPSERFRQNVLAATEVLYAA